MLNLVHSRHPPPVTQILAPQLHAILLRYSARILSRLWMYMVELAETQPSAQDSIQSTWLCPIETRSDDQQDGLAKGESEIVQSFRMLILR